MSEHSAAEARVSTEKEGCREICSVYGFHEKFCPACRAGGDSGEHQRGCLVASVARAFRQEEDSIDVDRWSRHLWHTSQHNGMPIFLGGRLQEQANEMRRAAGLVPFGWGNAFPDAEFGECSVHSDGCAGQETHALISTSAPQEP